MSGAALIAMPATGEMAVWRVVDAGPPLRLTQRAWSWQIGAFCLGLLATAGGAAAVWQHARPDTLIRTRIVADGATDAATRSALSEVALRLAATSARTSLQEGGAALDITVQDRDPDEAEQRARSLVDALLDVPLTGQTAVAPLPPADPAAALRTERARLAAAADAADGRAAAISNAFTGLTRDAATASRSAAEHKPGRETLEKGEAALADLQLQRLQLVSKYQDTYPAVLALDQQIRNLHVFLADEAHRLEAHPATATPSDTLLNGERDRLRAELTELDDRRRSLAAQVARTDQRLAALPSTPLAEPVATMPPPVLVAAATTSFAAPDSRPRLVGGIACAGLFLSGLVAMLARRRPAPFRHRLVLDGLPASLLAADHTLALPASAGGAAVVLPARLRQS